MNDKATKSTNSPPKKKKGEILSDREKSIIINLLNKKKMTEEEIANLVSIGRPRLVNIKQLFGILKKDKSVEPVSDEELEEYKKEQEAKERKETDFNTGLNIYKHERIIRSREAMILAVHLYNNPAIKFKSEFFSILAISAWSYLLAEYYITKKGIPFVDNSGNPKIPSITDLLDLPECPLERAVKKNIEYINNTRNAVSHAKEIGNLDIDSDQFEYYQACCLNFNKVIKDVLDERYGLERELSIALQFGKFDIQQVESTSGYELPSTIMKLRVDEADLDEEILNDERYKYNSIIIPKNIARNINFDEVDETGVRTLTRNDVDFAIRQYSYSAQDVVNEVARQTGEKFNMHNHTIAWKKCDARPNSNIENMEEKLETVREWCAFLGFRYVYTQEWVDFLVKKVKAGESFHNV